MTFSVAQIRKSFLDFFVDKGHTVVPSSPLVPGNDPTLMFTNSGMVQFKEVFLGTDQRPYTRAVSVQACLRAGGKHNDLENVGYTARHHTFFEMLGNWSFGDYFKRESLKWGWELLTHIYKLPPERLWATVYHEDDEAYAIWTQEIGLPQERVIRIGDNKGGKYKSDNFWMMAETGPCGPCSEIFYDHGAHIAGGPPGSPDEDGDRFIEIWNHVFMQYQMHEDGSLTALPLPCVDTGMGLERLAAVLQHVHSNYEIDLLDALVKAAARETGCLDLGHASLRVIADHIRATAFLAAEGVLPSNEGRGYVERRIVRRAIRHGYKLGKQQPFFHRLVPDLVGLMGEAYPALKAQATRIAEVLQAEEERFFETIGKGMHLLEEAITRQGAEKPNHKPNLNLKLDGELAFKLHDTYGFPLDLTQDICRERGLAVDVAGFNAAMARQKSQARTAGKFKMDKALDYTGAPNTFVGYEVLQLQMPSAVLALYVKGESVQRIEAGQRGVVVLETTPFYAESGGQVGDQGALLGVKTQAVFAVEDTQKIKADVFGHHGVLEHGAIEVGEQLDARVDAALRQSTKRNHSATHLLHKALRDVLGDHVQQKGSLVNAQRTRFDFTHDAPLSEAQIAEIEHLVNTQILSNSATKAQSMTLEAARQSGAVMLFGEKYGEQVRMLSIGQTQELCGGTHVARTGDLGLFKIVAQSGVAAGVRRIEAVTGEGALQHVQTLTRALQEAAEVLGSPPAELTARLYQTLASLKTLERELAATKGKLAKAQSHDLAAQAVDVAGVKVLVSELAGADVKTLRETLDQLKDKLQTAVVVLAVREGDKVQMAAGVTRNLHAAIKAVDLIHHIAPLVGARGGGKADMAMAGGGQAAGLQAALDAVVPWVRAIKESR